MHAILRRCLELETRSTLETAFEIKVDQKQRVLLLLAYYFHFLSLAINEVLQLEIRSPQYVPWMQVKAPTHLSAHLERLGCNH